MPGEAVGEAVGKAVGKAVSVREKGGRGRSTRKPKAGGPKKQEDPRGRRNQESRGSIRQESYLPRLLVQLVGYQHSLNVRLVSCSRGRKRWHDRAAGGTAARRARAALTNILLQPKAPPQRNDGRHTAHMPRVEHLAGVRAPRRQLRPQTQAKRGARQ